MGQPARLRRADPVRPADRGVSQVTNGGGSLPGGFPDDVELANAAYGQAETLVTPLQMALVAATVANGGVLMRPHLVTVDRRARAAGRRTVGAEHGTGPRRRATPRTITTAMVQAVEGRYGRLFTTGRAGAGHHDAGKSGTAQLGGTGEPHSWFIGFAPAEQPAGRDRGPRRARRPGRRAGGTARGQLLAAWKTWAGQ